MIKKNNIEFQFKARYFTSGILNENTRFIWMVFHGYGQLASFFIKKFDGLNNGHFVIAPEGLSRFYLANTSGRVGASWMTKEDRLTDIENQLNYFDGLYQSVKTELNNGAKLVVLGFSQGTATAMRWVVNREIKPYRLLLWAGTIPPDLNAENKEVDLSDIDSIIIQGDSDPYLGTEYMQNMGEWIKKYKMNPQYIGFNGGHEIKGKPLKQIVADF